jgi:hypothetical protein
MKATIAEGATEEALAPSPSLASAASSPEHESWPFVERRSGQDRRFQPTRWYDSLLGHRRRRRGRRKGESRNIYVDLYHAGDLILVLSVFVLNLLDAGLTLHHLSAGAVEQNPLMDQLIQWGPLWFLAQKILVVGLCMVALLVHKTFALARHAAYALLVVYGFLAVYHMTLL